MDDQSVEPWKVYRLAEMIDLALTLPALYPYAYAVARHHTDATEVADLVQESMLKAWQARDTEIRNAKAWLSTIVMRTCLDERRLRRNQYQHVAWCECETRSDPTQRIELQDAIALLQRHLTPQQWRMLVLYYEGYSYAEIAQVEGMTVGAVKSAMRRGRLRAKEVAELLREDQRTSTAP